MTHRVLALGLVLSAVLCSAGDARAQLRPGIHAARATWREVHVGGTTDGVGGSLEVSFPLVPVDVFVAGEYFFLDCGAGDCSLWGGSADLHLTMPLPVLTPYGAVGVVYRQYASGDVSAGATGFGVGGGVNLGTTLLGAYLEARYEFVDPDDQLVLRLGIRF
jgi:hypothetical protein